MSINRRLRIALWSSALAGLFVAVLTIIVTGNQTQLTLYPLDETDVTDVSVAALVVVASFLIVLVTVAVHYRRLAPVGDRVNWVYQLVGRIGSAVLGAFFMVFVSALLALILQNVFPGAVLTFPAALVVLTIAGAALCFLTAYVAVYLNTSQLLVLSGVTLLTGLTLAAALAEDRDWWQNSLSFLGYNDGSNILFDFALILGGLVILAVMGDVLRDLDEICHNDRITRRSYNLMRVLVLSIGIGIILIGLFPTRVSQLSFIIHQVSAWVVFGAFLFLMAAIDRLLPIYPAWFIRLGRVLFALSIVSIVAHMVFNVISFVALEVILIALVAPWSFLFAQQTDKLVTGEALDLALTPEFLKRVTYAAWVGLLVGAFSGIATLLTVYRLEVVALFSDDGHSLAAIGLFLSFPVALIATVVSYRRFSSLPRNLLQRVIVSIVVALLASLITLATCYILNVTFTGTDITPLSASAFLAVVAAVVGFGIGYTAPYFDIMQELTLTAIVFGVGILIATTHAADPLWWQNSISFLGHDSGAFLVFSVTLILCGMLVIAVGGDVLSSLEAWEATQQDGISPTRLSLLRNVLLLLGLFIIGIGLFPTTVTRLTNDLHNISSHGMLLTFLLLMFGLNRLVPAYPALFITAGYGLGIIAIINIVLYFAGVYNYVIMEFILIIILGIWLYLFVRYTRQITGDTVLPDLSDNPQVALE